MQAPPALPSPGGDSAARSLGYSDLSAYNNAVAAYQNYQQQNSPVGIAQQLQQMQIQANQPAIQTMTAAGGTLEQAYQTLLGQITAGSQVAANSMTQNTEQALAARGLLPSDYMSQTNLANALLPTAATYGGLAGSTTAMETNAQLDLAGSIAGLQAGNVGNAISGASSIYSSQAQLAAAQIAGTQKPYTSGQNGAVLNQVTGQLSLPTIGGTTTSTTPTVNNSSSSGLLPLSGANNNSTTTTAGATSSSPNPYSGMSLLQYNQMLNNAQQQASRNANQTSTYA